MRSNYILSGGDIRQRLFYLDSLLYHGVPLFTLEFELVRLLVKHVVTALRHHLNPRHIKKKKKNLNKTL